MVKLKNNIEINLQSAKTILVIKLDGIGDFILISSFLRELRINAQSSTIILIILKKVESLAVECPYTDKVLVFPSWKSPIFKNFWLKFKCYLFAMTSLQKENIDLAIIPRWDIDYHGANYIAKYSRAKRRLGYSENVSKKKSARNKNYDTFLTDAVSDSGIIHEIDKSLYLLSYLGGKIESSLPAYWGSEKAYLTAKKMLSPYIQNPLIGLGIGASSENRKWPYNRFAQIAEILYKKYGVVSILLGSNEDIITAKKIENSVSCIILNLVGKTNLPVLSEIISNCNIIIGNDSGIIHIATWVKRPSIIISPHNKEASHLSTATPERFGPRGVNFIYLQPDKPIPPCQNACKSVKTHCITGIEVETVLNKFIEIWN